MFHVADDLCVKQFVELLKSAKSSAAVKAIHTQILRSHHRSNVFLANTVVQKYGKCGDLEQAFSAFNSINRPNVFSWTIMLSAFAQNGHLRMARQCFDLMPIRDVFSWIVILTAYAQIGNTEEAKKIFDAMPEKDVVSWTVMLTAYTESGDLLRAKDWFDRMPERNQISVGTLLSAYAENGHVKDAKSLFDSIATPTAHMYTSMASAYAKVGELENAERMFHLIPEKDLIARTTMIQAFSHNGCLNQARKVFDQMPLRDAMAWNAMITAYARHGSTADAKALFDEAPVKNIASWNAMVSGFSINGKHHEAMEVVRQMMIRCFKLKLNAISFITALGACAEAGDISVGRDLHHEIVKSDSERDERIAVSLIDMYGKCGCLGDAVGVFGRMARRDVVSWTALITAFGLNRRCDRAFGAFAGMDLDGVQPNEITFMNLLNAVTELKQGRLVHAEIVDAGLRFQKKLDTALLDMYGRCGSLGDAEIVFQQMVVKDVAVFSAMISSFAQGGQFAAAIRAFEMIIQEGIQPDAAVFVTILSVCSHAGISERGREIFVGMQQEFGVFPSVDHYSCMVDLLGRSGQVQLAQELIDTMPFEPDAVPWTMLLDACKVDRNKSSRGLATVAASRQFALEPQSSAPYMQLSKSMQG